LHWPEARCAQLVSAFSNPLNGALRHPLHVAHSAAAAILERDPRPKEAPDGSGAKFERDTETRKAGSAGLSARHLWRSEFQLAVGALVRVRLEQPRCRGLTGWATTPGNSVLAAGPPPPSAWVAVDATRLRPAAAARSMVLVVSRFRRVRCTNCDPTSHWQGRSWLPKWEAANESDFGPGYSGIGYIGT
jgi:hypothetical protein